MTTHWPGALHDTPVRCRSSSGSGGSAVHDVPPLQTNATITPRGAEVRRLREAPGCRGARQPGDRTDHVVGHRRQGLPRRAVPVPAVEAAEAPRCRHAAARAPAGQVLGLRSPCRLGRPGRPVEPPDDRHALHLLACRRVLDRAADGGAGGGARARHLPQLLGGRRARRDRRGRPRRPAEALRGRATDRHARGGRGAAEADGRRRRIRRRGRPRRCRSTGRGASGSPASLLPATHSAVQLVAEAQATDGGSVGAAPVNVMGVTDQAEPFQRSTSGPGRSGKIVVQ